MERTFASALVLMAHPDDGDFMCGGTVAAWVRAGTQVDSLYRWRDRARVVA